VLLVSQHVAADGQHGGSQEPPQGGNDEKHPHRHMAEADYVAQGVLGKAGDEKQDEDHPAPLVFHEVVVFLKDCGADGLFHKGQAQPAGQRKGEPGADGKGDGGIDRAGDGAVDVAADEAGHFPGNRCEQDLEDLQADEHQHRQGTEGIDEIDGLVSVREELDKIVMNEKPGSAAEKQPE